MCSLRGGDTPSGQATGTQRAPRQSPWLHQNEKSHMSVHLVAKDGCCYSASSEAVSSMPRITSFLLQLLLYIPGNGPQNRGVDFAGPFQGSMYLIVIDAHSKWMDVHPMQSITSSCTIEKLRIIFANHGIPRKIMTDNGTSFTSAEFAAFISCQPSRFRRDTHDISTLVPSPARQLPNFSKCPDKNRKLKEVAKKLAIFNSQLLAYSAKIMISTHFCGYF